MADEPLKNDNNLEEDEREESPEKAGKTPVRKDKRQRRRQQSRSSQDSGQSTQEYKRPMTRFRPRRKVCAFCVDKVKVIDWKDTESLRRFVASNGSIRARRKTGTCAKHQRQLAVAIKRARHLALMPFTDEHLRLAGKG